jgi:hypothetical protein
MNRRHRGVRLARDCVSIRVPPLSQESRVGDGIEGLESRGQTPGEIQSTSLLRSAGGVTVGVGAEATLTARSTRGGGGARLGTEKVG